MTRVRATSRERRSGGLVFFEESGGGLTHLILFAEDKVRIGINYLPAVQVHERYVGDDLDLERRGLPGGQVIGDDASPYLLDGPLQHSIGPRWIGRDPEFRSLDELAGDSGSELLFNVKGGRLIGEDGDGDGFDVGGEAVCASGNLIPAGKQGSQDTQGKKQEAMPSELFITSAHTQSISVIPSEARNLALISRKVESRRSRS